VLLNIGHGGKLFEVRVVMVMILRWPRHTGVLLLVMPGGIVLILLTLIVAEITPVLTV